MSAIIERHKLAPFWMRILYFCLTLLMWALWLYLLLPMLSLFPYFSIFSIVDKYTIFEIEPEQLIAMLKFVVFITGIVFLVIIIWSQRNRRRYSHENKRKTIVNSNISFDVDLFEVSKSNIHLLKASKTITFDTEKSGDFAEAVVGEFVRPKNIVPITRSKTDIQRSAIIADAKAKK